MKLILRGAGLAVILLTASLGAKTAQGATCEGNCNVSCGSGATYSYYVPNYMCCDYLTLNCPDGSSPRAIDWWPVTCGQPETC
jgi:hypothetical protein